MSLMKYRAAIFTLLLLGLLAIRLLGEDSPSPQSRATPELKSPMTGTSGDEQLFFCTTRIEMRSADGKTGRTGTGFIIADKVDDKRQMLFLVTCRHVVEGFPHATLSFVAAKDNKPHLGERCEVTIDDFDRITFFHSDPKIDVALVPFVPILKYFEAQHKRPFFRSIDRALVPTAEQADQLSAIQSILFVGYPAGIRDEINLLPMARRGFTSTPYAVDYNGLPLFVVDATVYPGSSGSPVLVLDQGMYPKKDGNITVGTRVHFLGLNSQAYFEKVEGEVQFKSRPTVNTAVYEETRYLNLGIVVKARAIYEAVDQFVKKYPPPKS